MLFKPNKKNDKQIVKSHKSHNNFFPVQSYVDQGLDSKWKIQ